MAKVIDRPKHIEEVLCKLHEGQWFGWSDSKNKIYSNLVIYDETKQKPNEDTLLAELKKLQDKWDENN